MGETARELTCRCGNVRCEARGVPILSAVCYCDDCQEGGHRIEAQTGAAKVMDADGGTPYLAFRDDRFECVAGKELLIGQQLKPNSPTQRFVASCCQTAMYVKFAPGFWVSAYRHRFTGDVPALEWRNQTRFRVSDLPMPDDLPTYRRFPLRLFSRLAAARVAMFLRR